MRSCGDFQIKTPHMSGTSRNLSIPRVRLGAPLSTSGRVLLDIFYNNRDAARVSQRVPKGRK